MKSHVATRVVLLTVPVALAVAAPASAGSPHTVDPTTMTPELNASYAPWTCMTTGGGITCTGEIHEDYQNERTDIECAGMPVYASGHVDSKTVRWHDADGRALKTSLQTTFSDRLTLSPTADQAAKSAVFSGHWHKHYTYPVPGSAEARVLTETGAVYRLQAAGEGILFQDTGTVTFVPNEEYQGVAESHGVHDVYDGSVDIDAAICDALS